MFLYILSDRLSASRESPSVEKEEEKKERTKSKKKHKKHSKPNGDDKHRSSKHRDESKHKHKHKKRKFEEEERSSGSKRHERVSKEGALAENLLYADDVPKNKQLRLLDENSLQVGLIWSLSFTI